MKYPLLKRGWCVCVCSVFHRTMPLLKGGPEHVHVGLLCQVDLASSFEDSPGLINALWLQVLSILNTFTIYAFIDVTIQYTQKTSKFSSGIVYHKESSCSHPGPELLIQSTGDQAALKEDAHPAVVLRNCSYLWFLLRLRLDCDLWPFCCLWPFCGCFTWI